MLPPVASVLVRSEQLVRKTQLILGSGAVRLHLGVALVAVDS